jgi:hypothetical protein
MFFALDVYVFTLTGEPVTELIPCPDQQCDFSSLSRYLPNDTITILDQLWSQRLSDKNISELYYCGNHLTARIETEPCNMIREHFTFAALTLLPLLALMLVCLDVRREKKRRQQYYELTVNSPPLLPKYEDLIRP